MGNQLNAAPFVNVAEHKLLDAMIPVWIQNIVKLFHAECIVSAEVQKRLHKYRLFRVWIR
jgi:hypothetical protein